MPMTLLEIERLIRKMSELLQQGGDPGLAPKLATDYAAACVAANLRLRQCEGMIKAGDAHQAIQLAETTPNLLDLITILDSHTGNEWRGFCHTNSLEIAERIEEIPVKALNDCYGQGITTDDPLYATYRRAVLDRNDYEALQTLQSIVRLNPTDSNAQAEMARLDAKVLAAHLEQLRAMLGSSGPARIVSAIESIEAVGFKTQLEGKIWREAAIVRCGFLLAQGAALKSSSQWMEAFGKLDFVRRLQIDSKLELPSAYLDQMGILDSWIRGEQEKARENREFAALLADLQHRVHQSEDKDTSVRYVELPELRTDYETLHKVWRSLTDFTRTIPDNVTAAFKKRSALLEAEIARRTNNRRRMIVMSSAAVLILGGVIVWFALGLMKARDFAGQLDAAVSNRRTREGERLLEQVRTSEKNLLTSGRVAAAVASAETFVTKERGLLANFETAFTKLPKELGGDPDVDRVTLISDQLTLTRSAFEVLAPDLKTESEPRLIGFEKQWQQFLAEGGVVVNRLFENWIDNAERECAKLDYRTPPEEATTRIGILSAAMLKINETETAFTKHRNLRSDLVQRAAAARAKFTNFDREMKKLDEGMIALANARTLDGFLTNIAVMTTSEFSTAPAQVSATAINSINPSAETTLRSLLDAPNATTWAFIKKGNPARLVPEIAMPAELSVFQQLQADLAVNANHQHFRLWLDRAGATTEEWFTVGPIDNARGWKKVHSWIVSATATQATFVEREYGSFGGQWKFYLDKPVYRLEKLPDLREASAFGLVGLSNVWSNATNHSGPLLPVLDAIKDSRDGSPIFRAYLFCKLVKLMELQPDAWGLSFCPSAREHVAQIRAIVGGEIVSGDWFVPSKANVLSEKLDRFFIAEKSLSYREQATGNLRLVQSVAKDGLRYVGFVGLAGKPIVFEAQKTAEMWGYAVGSKQPGSSSRPLRPLSPLFGLPASTTEYLRNASVTVGTPTFRNPLPPLFQSTTKP